MSKVNVSKYIWTFDLSSHQLEVFLMFIYSQMPPVGGGDPTGGSNATPLAAFLLAGAEAVSPVSCRGCRE